MREFLRRWQVPTVALGILIVLALSPVSLAGWGWGGDDEDDEEIPWDVAEIYFELNNTDGDLGIHGLIDGEPWKTLSIEMPNERENVKIRLKDRFRRQGLTELFFESAEPTFDELDPEDFFNRFPEGEYEVEGRTLDGEELESTAVVTHLLPAPAGNFSINGVLLPEKCDVEPLPSVSEPLTLSWDAVTQSHPELGRTNEPVTIVRYELVVEREDGPELKFSVQVTPDVTEITLPAGLVASGDLIKAEILAREESDNQTATETCFEVD